MPNNAQMLKRRVDNLSSSSSDTRSKELKSSTANSHSEVLLFVQPQDTVQSTTSSTLMVPQGSTDTSITAASSQSTTTFSTQTIADASDLSVIIQSLEDLSSSATPYFYLSNPSLNSVTATLTDINSVLAEVSKAHIYSLLSLSLTSSSTSYSSVSVVTTLSYPSNSDNSGSTFSSSQFSSMFYNSTQQDSSTNSTSILNNSGDSYLFSNGTLSNYSLIETITVKNVHTFTEGVVVTSTVVHGSSTLKITATIVPPEMTTIAFVYTQPYDVIQTTSGKLSSFEFDLPTTVTTAVPVNYQLLGLSVENFHTMTMDYAYYQLHFSQLKDTNDAKKKSGVIAGLVIGSIAGILLLAFLFYFVAKKKNQKTSTSSDNEKEKKSSSQDDGENKDTFLLGITNPVTSFLRQSNDFMSLFSFVNKSKKEKDNTNIFDDGYNYGQYDDLLSNRSGGASSMAASLASSASSFSETSSNLNADGSFDSSESNNNNNSANLMGNHFRHHRNHQKQHGHIPGFQNMRRKSGESNSSCDSSGSGGLFSMRESILKNAGGISNSEGVSSQRMPYVVYVGENNGSEFDNSLFKKQYSINGGNYDASEKVGYENDDDNINLGPKEITRPSPVASPQKNNIKDKKTENKRGSIYNGGGFLAGGRRRVIDTVYEESINSSAASNNEDNGSRRSSISDPIKVNNNNQRNRKSFTYNNGQDLISRSYNHQLNGGASAVNLTSSNSGRRYSSAGLLKYYNNRSNGKDEEYEPRENEEDDHRIYNSENNFGYVENEDEEDENMEQIKNPFEESFIEEGEDENEL